MSFVITQPGAIAYDRPVLRCEIEAMREMTKEVVVHRKAHTPQGVPAHEEKIEFFFKRAPVPVNPGFVSNDDSPGHDGPGGDSSGQEGGGHDGAVSKSTKRRNNHSNQSHN